MGKYFGTDGFRGEANINLTVEHAFAVGRFIGWYYGKRMNKKCRVVIGKDTRRSSYMFEYALSAGLTASGADAYLLHVTTTPSVSYVTRTEGFSCGIMISASHNPFYDNGIKLINGSGEKMEEEVIAEIEKYFDHEYQEIPHATREEIGMTTDYAAGRNRYVGYLISLATSSFQGVTVGLDCAHGSSFTIAKSVFDALGATVYTLADKPNGLNINLDCGSTHIQNLQKLVVEEGLDVGFAFDGDADRCLCVDEKGQVVDGDKILYICGKYMKKTGELKTNKVVTTVMSNLGLYKALDKANIGYEKTAVGDKYVYENMREYGHRLGGEQSGHIIFSKYATTGDGILTSLRMMEVMLEEKESLSKLGEELVIYPQKLVNVRVTDKTTVLDDQVLKDEIARVEEELGSEGRVLVRPSGTEPLIRVMVEAKEDADCDHYTTRIIEKMKERGYVKEA